MLSTFLNEMDGIVGSGDGGDGLLVVAATNRPASLDAALLRPGRFEAAVHVSNNVQRLFFSARADPRSSGMGGRGGGIWEGGWKMVSICSS